MSTSSRRAILVGSVSAVALVALYGASYGISPPEFFYDRPKKDAISFAAAQQLSAEAVKQAILRSEKELGAKYSPEEVERIQARMWETAKYVLSENYRALEDRTSIEPPIAGTRTPATTGTTGGPGGPAGLGGPPGSFSAPKSVIA